MTLSKKIIALNFWNHLDIPLSPPKLLELWKSKSSFQTRVRTTMQTLDILRELGFADPVFDHRNTLGQNGAKLRKKCRKKCARIGKQIICSHSTRKNHGQISEN